MQQKKTNIAGKGRKAGSDKRRNITVRVQHGKHGLFTQFDVAWDYFHGLSKDSGQLFLALWSEILSSKEIGLREVDFLMLSLLFLQAG